MTRTAQVAAAVEAARGAAGLSEEVLAEVTHIPRSTLKRRLAGVSPFNVEELEAVAQALGISWISLLEPAA